MQLNKMATIQSLWIGGELSVMEQLCISSFLFHGHPFHLYVYDEVDGVPAGTVIKDANVIIPAENIFKYKDHDSYAGFSNVFRYKLLYEKGSYWVDTDMICLRPFALDADYVFASTKARGRASIPYKLVNGNVIKTPPGSAIMEFCYSEAIKRDHNALKWGDIGPFLLTEAVSKYRMKKNMESSTTFCPIHYWRWRQIISGRLIASGRAKLRLALYRPRALHLWNEMWRRDSLDKNANYPHDSVFERLKRQYLKTN